MRHSYTAESQILHSIVESLIRALFAQVVQGCLSQGFTAPRVIHAGNSISVKDVILKLEPRGLDTTDSREGELPATNERFQTTAKIEYDPIFPSPAGT